jgi:hypothetical protein
MDPDDVDEYMHSEGHDSYLVPDEFTGEIVFSQSFFKGLTNDTYSTIIYLAALVVLALDLFVWRAAA